MNWFMLSWNAKELEGFAVNFSLVVLACLPHIYTMVPISSWLLLMMIFFVSVNQLMNSKIWMNSSVVMWWLFLCFIFEGSLYSSDVSAAIGYVLKFSILVLFLSYLPEKKDEYKIIRCVEFLTFVAVASIIAEFFFPDFIGSIRNFLAVNSLNDKVISFSSIEQRMAFFSANNGFFTDPAVSAFYCAVGVSIGVYYLVLDKAKRLPALLWILLSVIGMILTYKRGPLLAVIFASLALFLVTSSYSIEAKVKAILKVLCVVGLAIFLFNTNETLSSWLDKINSNEASTRLRANIYAELWENFKEHPLLGSGTKSTKLLLDGLDGHNIYLASLSENGAIATIIFVLALFLSIIETIKILKIFRNSNNRRDESVVSFCLFMQLYICAYGLTGSTFSNLYSLSMYFMCVAIPIRLCRSNECVPLAYEPVVKKLHN